MRSMLAALLLGVLPLQVLAEGEQIRFGAQGSLNQYTVDDPLGPTAKGSGPGLSAIALIDVGRESRALFTVYRDSYSLQGTQTNVGQDVTALGGGVSYQKMVRATRSWKPWIGLGVGYASTTYKNRFLYTAGGFKQIYADRTDAAFSVLLNANTEWEFNRDWDIGLMAQYARSISDKAGSIRVGLYFVY